MGSLRALLALHLAIAVLSQQDGSSSCGGDIDCDIYDSLSVAERGVQEAGARGKQVGPPDQTWESQGLGQVPPGSADVLSKREDQGGAMYGR